MRNKHSYYRQLNINWCFRFLLLVYRFAWYCLLPFAIFYLFKKSQKEPLYRQHITERFGIFLPPSYLTRPIWIHAASMGELKAIVPLIQALLNQNHQLLITTLTPAGKQTAQQYFKQAIINQQLQISYAPLELSSAVKKFIRHHQPLCALMSEIDTWPVLITTLKQQKVPLGFINAQYPKKSFERDSQFWGFRRELFKFYDLIACKSATHAQRFLLSGNTNVHTVGELRFDLPIPAIQIQQANHFKSLIHQQRPIITLASIVAGEEDLFVRVIQQVNQHCVEHSLFKPFWIVVPRSPQRFQVFHQKFSPINLLLRSSTLNADLSLTKGTLDQSIDGILGDSLGEMYFYLQPSNCVVVGASFVPLGSHNIIEPIALKKPVIVGNSVWGIEYPGVEALEAGVLQQCIDERALINALIQQCTSHTPTHSPHDASNAYETFYANHTGSTAKHVHVLKEWLAL